MPNHRVSDRRKDAFDVFLRRLDRLNSPDKYSAIQAEWARRRKRIDEFREKYTILKPRVGNVEILLRPVIGRGLDLLVRIPPGVTKTDLKSAIDEVHSWRECLTAFEREHTEGCPQNPIFRLSGIELAGFNKLKNGRYHFWHREPLEASNDLNRLIEHLLNQDCLVEVRELLQDFGVKNAERWIQHIGTQGLKVHIAKRNHIERVIGPITPKLIENLYKAWRKRQSLQNQLDPTELA